MTRSDFRGTAPVAAVFLVLLLGSAPATARAEALLPVTNQSVLARGAALPELGAAEVLPQDANELRFAIDWTNEFVAQTTRAESIVLDDETQRYAWNWRHGLGHGFDAGLQLPFYVSNGGTLDGVIENYHHAFGLPNGGRGAQPKDRLLVRYQRGSVVELDRERSVNEFGDVELTGGWQALPGLALRALAKLPTGHADHLTGGNAGGALWLDYDPFAGSARWLGFVSAGGEIDAKNGPLAEQQHRGALFAGAGAGYRLWRPFALMAQLYGHSPLYHDSQTTPLRRDGLQLGIGGRYDFNPHLALNAGFQEDLVPDSSPDISLHLDVTLR